MEALTFPMIYGVARPTACDLYVRSSEPDKMQFAGSVEIPLRVIEPVCITQNQITYLRIGWPYK